MTPEEMLDLADNGLMLERWERVRLRRAAMPEIWARRLLAKGCVLEHRSASGSIYIRTPRGHRVRISDHRLPNDDGQRWRHRELLSCDLVY